MHAAFLSGRAMQVKIGNILSDKLTVTGGAVQGSILGVMDHNAVLEDLEDDFEQRNEKYVDDMTLFEGLNSEIPACVNCLLYTSPSPRDVSTSRMPSSA